MDTSDSSDDDVSAVVKTKQSDETATKLSNKDQKPSISDDGTDTIDMPVIHSNKTIHTQRKKNPKQAGLDGKYWNNVQSDRHVNGDVPDYRRMHGDGTSSSEETVHKLSGSSSSSSSSGQSDDENLLYKKQTYVTCRNTSDSYYLCQVLQNVYVDTKQIRIRWCAVIGEDGDETQISIKTRFRLAYSDKLHSSTILTGIENVLHHDDGSISLKKQDIVETKRLLTRSIRGRSSSSDDMMDLSTEHRTSNGLSHHTRTRSVPRHIRFVSSDESDTSPTWAHSSPISSTTKKRKMTSAKNQSRKQSVKKRPCKARISGPAKQSTKTTFDSSDTEDEFVKPKKKSMADIRGSSH